MSKAIKIFAGKTDKKVSIQDDGSISFYAGLQCPVTFSKKEDIEMAKQAIEEALKIK